MALLAGQNLSESINFGGVDPLAIDPVEFFAREQQQPVALPTVTPPPEVELPGIFETALEAVKLGTKSAVADTFELFGTAEILPFETRLANAKKADEMRTRAFESASDSYKKLLSSEDAPFGLQTVNAVAGALPLLATAAGTTILTKNPLLGASVFTAPVFDSFYNQTLSLAKEQTGTVTPKDADRARAGAALDAGFMLITETSLPQTAFLKGGTFVKRAFRGGTTNAFEETLQGSFETTLRTVGWEDPKELSKNLMEEVPMQALAGAILGSSIGGMTPSQISDFTRGEIKNKFKKQLTADAKKKGSTRDLNSVDSTVERLLEVYDANAAFINGGQFTAETLSKRLSENKELLNIGVVTTFSDGKAIDSPSPWILFSKEERRRGSEIASSALTELNFGLDGDKKYVFEGSKTDDKNTKALPPHVQLIAKTKAAEMIGDGLSDEQVHDGMIKFYENVGTLNSVFQASVGKEQGDNIGSSIPTFTFTYGFLSAEQLADELKLTQPERGKPFSILPKNLIIQASQTLTEREAEAKGNKQSTVEGIYRAIDNAYQKSSRTEVLPTEEDIDPTDLDPVNPVNPILDPVDSQFELNQTTRQVQDQTTLSSLVANNNVNESTLKTLGLNQQQSIFLARHNDMLSRSNIAEQFGIAGVTVYLEARLTEFNAYNEALPQVEVNIINNNIQGLDPQMAEEINKASAILEEFSDVADQALVRKLAKAVLSATPSLVYPGLPGYVHDTMSSPQTSSILESSERALTELNNYFNQPGVEEFVGSEPLLQLQLSAKIMEIIHKANTPKNTNTEAMEVVNEENTNRNTGEFDEFTAEGYANDNVTIDSFATSLIARIQGLRQSLGVLFKDKDGVAIVIDRPGTFLSEAGKNVLATDPQLQAIMIQHELLWEQLAETLSPNFIAKLRALSSQQLDQVLVSRDMEQDEWHASVAQFVKDGKSITGFSSELPISLIAVEPPAGKTGVKAGKNIEISGSFVIDQSQASEGKVLIRNGEDIWVSPSQIAKIINLSSFLSNSFGVDSPVKTKFLGNQLPPKPPSDDVKTGGFDDDTDPENSDRQKANYDQYKAMGDQDAHNPTEVPGAPDRPVPLRSFFKSLSIFKFPSMVKRYLASMFGTPKEIEFLNSEKSKKAQTNLSDEVIHALHQDKLFQGLAEQLALSQLAPLRQRFQDIIQERVSEKLGIDPKQADTVLQGLMQWAGEEVFSKKGNANSYSVTDVGLGGKHLTQEAADAHQRWMVEFHEALGLPFTDNDILDWQVSRDEMAFFNLLGSIDPELQSMLTYYKAEIEYPVLEAGLKVGLFKSANMWTNISKGFQHRITLSSKEKGSGGKAQVVRGINLQGQNFRTMSEYASATENFGLEPETGFFAATRGYVRDYVTHVQQAQSLQALKGMLANVPFKYTDIPNYSAKSTDEANKVDDLIGKLALVEYVESSTVKEIAKITGQTPQLVMEAMRFFKNPSTPGLANWSGGKFSQPWVYQPLSDAIDTMFTPVGDTALTTLNSIQNAFKRALTINPFDATFLWLSAVLVNSSPKELFTLFGDYTKLILTDPPFVGKTGRSILKGDFFPIGDLDMEKYENLPLFIAKGFTGFGYHPAMAAAYDERALGKFPGDLTLKERLFEYFKSFGGSNAAIFNVLVAQRLYGTINKFYEKNLKKIDPRTGETMTKDKAASLAVSAMNDFSFLVHPAVYGKKEGPIKNFFIFTRGLTIGFIRQLTGGPGFQMLDLFGKVTGRKVTDKVFKHRTEGIGRFLNDIFHGEKTQADMAILAPEYTKHLGNVVFKGLLLNGIIQYALSFMDDGEKDEHGNTCESSDLLCKKRLMWNNEPGRRFSIRLPNSFINQINGRRSYLNFQMLREATHIGKIVFDQLPVDGVTGKGFLPQVLQWGLNRMNFGLTYLFDLHNNIDRNTGGKIFIPGSGLVENVIPNVVSYTAEELKPLGLTAVGLLYEKAGGKRDNFFIRRGEDIQTMSEGQDVALALFKFFGIEARQGRLQAGITIKEQNKIDHDKMNEKVDQLLNRRAESKGASPIGLIGPDTGVSLQSAVRKKLELRAPRLFIPTPKRNETDQERKDRRRKAKKRRAKVTEKSTIDRRARQKKNK